MDATPDRSFFPWMTAGTATGLATPFGNGEMLGGVGKAWMQEVTALVAARLRADADAVLAMSACTTLTDLAQVQQRWFSEAGQAYSEASQRLMRVVMDAAKTAAEPPAVEQAPTA